MKVIIPVAGRGTRLRPHTHTKPKPLVTVAGKPVLGHVLDTLGNLRPDEIIFIVGYLGEQIEEYVESHYDFAARYVEQKELKGQAHAIGLAKEYIDGPVLIIFVDTIADANLDMLPRLEADGAIFVKQVEDPRRFGVVTLDEQGYITRFVEKPDRPISNLAVIGIYYLKDSALMFECIDELIARDIQTKGEYYLADALQLMVDRGSRLVAPTVEVWEDCGTPEAVLQTNRYLLENGRAEDASSDAINSVIISPVHIHPTAHIRNSVIGPYVTVAAGCRIEDSIIRDSIIDEGSIIVDTMLDRSLIGKDAFVKGRFRRLNVGDSASVDFSSDGD
ncbi:MAG: nucleotidyltransferase [Chloroflexi bacterium]|nr:MAG: nucleotidyltransferase [Chloroflexota bacterium]